LKLLELDPVSENEAMVEEGPAVEQELDIGEQVEMSSDAAREVLCEALKAHLGCMVDLIFG
jgi:hypothetical protein